MANLSLTNAKRVAAKLEAAGITVNRMGKRNDNRYSLQVVNLNGTYNAVAELAAAVEALLTAEKAIVKTMKSGVVRVLVAPLRDAKGHFIKKSA
jgi:hypothetical protein